MRLFLFFVLMAFAPASLAKVCTQDALRSQKAGTDHLVISFEGLMSYGAGFVRKTLISSLSSRHPNGFYSKNLSYTSVNKAIECINDWDIVFKSNYKLSIIGHSFGGGIATFSLLEKIKNVRVDTVVTLDPRSWSSDSLARKNKTLTVFVAPANVDTFVNFYQRGGMPGYIVKGARNFELKNTRHTKVPAHPTVLKQSECLLFGVCL